MHIAIEGIDGVGKTTTAKLVADRLNWKLVEKPLKNYLFGDSVRIRDYFKNQTDSFLMAWFHGFGNIFLYDKFKEENIVTDRHLLSNYCWNGTEDSEKVFDLLVKRLGSPTYTFILYADKETVLKRLSSRDLNDSDKENVDFIPTAYEKMKNFCKKYEMPYTMIDTSNLSAKEVADFIVKNVNISCFDRRSHHNGK
jgi:thymidylate kinase